ncbi:MAG: SdrD B-like domain-containing protein [Gammaproteobacteria bacterium]
MTSTKLIALAALLGSSSLCHAEISGSGHQIAGCTGVIDSTVWQDANGNGIWDDGEKPLRNVALSIQRAHEPELGIDTLVTDDDGRVRFFNLCLADHLLWVNRDTLPFGMTPTAIHIGSEHRDVLDDAIPDRNGAIFVGLSVHHLQEEIVNFGFAPKECDPVNRRCVNKGPGDLSHTLGDAGNENKDDDATVRESHSASAD